jgi:outer membrane murein-binding lipoprotein Lpp
MSEEIKDVNAKVDELEAAAKKYASKDTVVSIGGYEFTPAKLMVAFTIVSSTLGGLYGCFEVYKDYMGMKDKIAKYVSPDLSELYK